MTTIHPTPIIVPNASVKYSRAPSARRRVIAVIMLRYTPVNESIQEERSSRTLGLFRRTDSGFDIFRVENHTDRRVHRQKPVADTRFDVYAGGGIRYRQARLPRGIRRCLFSSG